MAKKFFIFCCCVIILFNSFGLWQKEKEIFAAKKTMPHQIIAYQFYGLEQFTKNFEYIGYYTDQDLKKNEEAARTFAQAQYWLAPSVLDLNNLNREYIIFVCSNEKAAFEKIAQIKAIPLKRNNFGMILAKRQL